MLHNSLVAYVIAASLLTVTPGLDTALVIKTATIEGPRRAAFAGLGIALGCFAWATLVALGLAALLAASHWAYALLRWSGAGYLIWIGYKMLRHPRHSLLVETSRQPNGRGAFVTGALTNILNPKIGVFYVSFLPQFVPHDVSIGPYILLLGAIHACLGMAWFVCLIAATRPISTFMRRPTVVQRCDRITGGAFIAFGVALALE